jgi:WD40 repeat protein/DNA-directed RNA polymerase subunit RPC12/RpoP
MSTRVKTSCPECGKSLKVDESLIGKHVRCPACRQRFLLSSVSFSGDGTRDPSLEAVQTIGGDGDGTVDEDAKQRLNEPSAGSIGRFEIKSALGGGGFGVVYRAFDPVLGREVALKVPKFGPEDAKRTQRFLIEAQAAAHLHHPNIVAVFESGQAGDKAFIASEYVAGKPLSVRSEENPPSFQEAALWTRALADALDYAHDEGIIHRDIKPDNIMMAAKDRPQIMDFGLAKRTDEDSSMTGDGSILGTPAYMSPEQARGETDRVGPHSDQYSLGVVLYELLTGKRPFEGPPHSVVAQVAGQVPPAPRKLNARIPEDLEAICQQAMEKEPENRYSDLSAMTADLDRWLSGRETMARPIGRFERLTRWCKRNPMVAGLTVALLVVMFAGTVVSLNFAVAARGEQRIAQEERDNAEAARRAAEQSQEDAEDAAKAARKSQEQESQARRTAENRLVESYLARGRSLCERGDVHHGMLWLARSLEILPTHADDLQHAIRMNLATWQQQLRVRRRVLQHNGRVRSVAFSPDDKIILTGSWDHTVRLWDASTGTPIGQPLQHPDTVHAAAFSPDGKTILTGCRDKIARLWDAATQKPVGEPLKHKDYVLAVAFSPDGMRILTGGKGKIARLWDAATRMPVAEPMKHPGWILDVTFSPDGETIVTACDDGSARFWDAVTLKPVGEPLKHPSGVRGIAFSPDGKRIVTACGDKTVRLWDSMTRELYGWPLKHDSRVDFATFSPDGETVVTACQDGKVWQFDAKSLERHSRPLHHVNHVQAVSFSSDGKTVLTGCADGTASLWDSAVVETIGHTIKHENQVRAVAFSSDGKRILTGCADGTARIWNATTAEAIGRPFPHPPIVQAVAFSPDGKRVLTGGRDATARIWDAATGEAVGAPLRHEQRVLGVDFSPDGALILTGSRDHTARLWDAATGTPIGHPLQHQNIVYAVAFSPDGKTILTGCSDNSARLWDAATLKPVGEPLKHRGIVQGIAFSPDGGKVATAASDGTARLWDARSGEPIGQALRHRVAGLFDVAFSPDGNSVVTASNAGAQLWDATSGIRIGRLMRHHNRVRAVAFSPDGEYILSGSDDTIAQFWKVPTPVEGSPDRIALWVQVIAGMGLNADGSFLGLNANAWSERRTSLSDVIDQNSGAAAAETRPISDSK